MSSKEQVKRLRKHLGLSQREFAKLMETHKSSISLWELGIRHPRHEMMRKLVALAKEKGLNMDYSDFEDNNDSIVA